MEIMQKTQSTVLYHSVENANMKTLAKNKQNEYIFIKRLLKYNTIPLISELKQQFLIVTKYFYSKTKSKGKKLSSK